MAGRKHVHKYIRRKMYAHSVWACALPDCTHYMPKHMEQMVEGKASICHQCNEEFILSTDALKEDKPRCADCRFDVVKHEDVAPIGETLLNYLEGKR